MKRFLANYRSWWILLPLLLVWLLGGCMPSYTAIKKKTRSIARTVTFSAEPYRKKVAIAYFDNQTYFEDENLVRQFEYVLGEAIETHCLDLVLVRPGDPDYPTALRSVPRSGREDIDNLALARIGRKHGFNAIVTGTLADISADEKEKGIIFFKRKKNIASLKLNLRVYDMVTAAKIVDDSVVHQAEVDSSAFASDGTKTLLDPATLAGAMGGLADRTGARICDRLESLAWQGYVVEANGGITLSSGQEVGISAGDRFFVHDGTQQVPGRGGERFFVPGEKVGEIAITSVSRNQAQARPIQDQGIQPGGYVVPR